jgi:sec-independent protein translocase protein TatA
MGISIWQLLIILVIAIVLFGTTKLKNLGGDLGGAIKSFRQSMRDSETTAESEKESGKSDKPQQVTHTEKTTVIDGQVTSERTKQG